MDSTLTDIDTCTKRLEVAVPRREVTEELERAYSGLARRVRLKGFRKGRIPRQILERYYGEEVQAEVMNRVISTAYGRLLAEKGMRPVGEANVTDVSMDDDAPELTFKATVEVIPPIELGEYVGIEVPVTRRPVTEEMVDREVEALLMRSATLEEVDRPAAEKDFVQFDIQGFDGEKPVPETKGENQTMLLGREGNHKELEAALLGMRKNEEKEVDIQVAEGAHPELAGRTLRFRIKVGSVKEPHPPALDEDFVRSLGQGFSTAEELRDALRRELDAMEESAARQRGVAAMLRRLVEAHPFEVPKTLVRKESETRLQDIERQLQAENAGARLPADRREELREKMMPECEARVRELILVDRIREKEGIQATTEELERQVQILAAQNEVDPQKLRERMAETGALRSLLSNINYNKAVDWLYGQAKIIETVEVPGGGAGTARAEASGGEAKEEG